MKDDAALHHLRRLEPDLAALAVQVKGAEVIDCGPFRALVSRTTDWANLAMPILPSANLDEVTAAVEELCRRFAERGRTPRFLFKEPFFPGLASMLEQAGLVLVEREPLMVCTPVSFRPFRNPKVSVHFLRATDPDTDLAAFQTIWSESLDDGSWVPTPDALAAFRSELDQPLHRAALASLGGRPVGTGFVASHGEGCEIMRVATIPAARRHGVGATVSSALVRAGFDGGATLAWLTATTAGARALYERVGFGNVGDELTFVAREV
ncbi:MAG: GNAT family N-acetyltransferase [Dehalococcoidia bacterium]